MKNQRYERHFSHGLLAGLLGGGACMAQLAFAADGASAPAAPADTSAGAAGMRVYVDPNTGAVLQNPPAGAPPLPLTLLERNSLSTSHQGLVEVPSATPGGGYILDLQGRFQSPLMATIDASGKVRMQHIGPPRATGHED